ncbi:ABC transporter ATP-binding protein [bacterium]|nr:ABC transporter ATP-binding protein [bacterium]
MININNLNVKAGEFSLQNINLNIEEHRFHVVIGPTGSGKTMLLESILGLRNIESGTISSNSENITRLPPEKRNMSYLPQDICLFPNYTVRENIYYSLKVKKLDYKKFDAFINHLTDFLNIENIMDRYPENLSGGEKQRVALVRSLAMKPRLLVLDEPFSSIDGVLREEAQRMLKELYSELKITTLMVTHDFDEAFFLADDVSVIIDGQIVQTAPKEKLYNFPRSLAAAKFLCFKNIYKGTVTDISGEILSIIWGNQKNPLKIKCSCAHKRFNIGDELYWGIRSENVIINSNKSHETNNFKGIIKKIYDRGKRDTLIIELENQMILEADIYNRSILYSDVSVDKKINVHFSPSTIFTINT